MKKLIFLILAFYLNFLQNSFAQLLNANNPNTPGVYTVEKNAFPNSVAEVPTAIPAFIGYTKKAELNGKTLTEPLLINSMAEYEQYFGGAPINLYPIKQVTSIEDGSGKKVIPSYDVEINSKYYKLGKAKAGKQFYLYYSLQLFYQNGGGPCYIMSIGNYTTEIKNDNGNFLPQPTIPNKGDFLKGLTLLPKIPFPKPTMILTPDALLLGSSDYYTIQEQVLLQCGELEDRVALIDVHDGYKGLDQGVISAHRNSIGNNYLKYGISYYPFLETTIVESTDMTYANVDQKAPHLQLSEIFTGESALTGLRNITADVENVAKLAVTPRLDFSKTLPATLANSTATIGKSYPSWRSAFDAFPAGANEVEKLQWRLRVLFTMAWVLHDLGDKAALDNPQISVQDNNLKKAIKKLTSKQSLVASQLLSLYAYDIHYASQGALNVLNATNLAKIGLEVPANIPGNPYAGSNARFDFAQAKFKAIFTTLSKAIASASSAAESLLHQYNGTLENNNSNYKKLMAAIAKQAGTLPPGPAMAGVYTLVDNTEGVWASPANRNINSIIAPTVYINNDQQASLNVDALAGKSINAIRSFYGRGPAIIWGARTLDGNSQDWRYVSIRRTMIMIEQSVANAAQQLAFQANDAATWKTCENKINNFLHNLWTGGALQGAKAADAYHVTVGLGKTMTPQDILNGIMRVQVKLAIVHPAEFIIINYEQQMAKP